MASAVHFSHETAPRAGGRIRVMAAASRSICADGSIPTTVAPVDAAVAGGGAGPAADVKHPVLTGEIGKVGNQRCIPSAPAQAIMVRPAR